MTTAKTYAQELTTMVGTFPLDVQSYFSEALSESPPMSMQTLLGYAYDFHVFWDYYCAPKGITRLEQMTPDLLRGFMAFLRLGYTAPGKNGNSTLHRVNSERGLARKKSALRTIFFYLSKVRRVYDHDPTEALEERRTRRRGGAMRDKLPVYLTQGETLQLKASLEQGGHRYEAYQWLNLRDFTIISVFIGTGVRVSELVALDEFSFNADLTLVRVLGKGNKIRTIPLSEEVREIVKRYQQERRGLEGVPEEHRHRLFLNRLNQPLTRKGVHDIVRLYCDRAGLMPHGKHVSPHKLRHTAATNWYRRGLDLYMLQQVLGHALAQTTQIYTHVSPREIIQAIQRIDREDLPESDHERGE